MYPKRVYIKIAGLFQESPWYNAKQCLQKSSVFLPSQVLLRYASKNLPKVLMSGKDEPPIYVGLDLPTMELVKKLSKDCLLVLKRHDVSFKKRYHVSEWIFDFVRLACLLENNFVLKSSKESSNLYHLYVQAISQKNESSISLKTMSGEGKSQHEEQVIFVKKLSGVLEKAGYVGVSDRKTKSLLEKGTDLKEIHLQADYENYSILKFWHRGRVDGHPAVWPLNSKMPQKWWDKKGYGRVVVVSNHKSDRQLYVREFFNVPENQFKLLLQENHVDVPLEQKVKIGSWKLITSSMLLINLVVFYGDLYNFVDLLSPISLAFIAFQTYRMEILSKRRLASCNLELKSQLINRFASSDDVLINNLLNNANNRGINQALLAYGAALTLDREGFEISAKNITNFSKEWLAINSNKGAHIRENYSIDAEAAIARLLYLEILYYDEDDSRLRVVTVDRVAEPLLREIVDDASLLANKP